MFPNERNIDIKGGYIHMSLLTGKHKSEGKAITVGTLYLSLVVRSDRLNRVTADIKMKKKQQSHAG